MTPLISRWLRAGAASAVLVAAVTAVIALLEPGVPGLGLGVLYLVAVVPIALVYGLAAAAAVSVASMAAFSYFFLPPRYSFDPGARERWAVLVAFLVSSLAVSVLAARSQLEAGRSRQLADEQTALRRVATLVTRGPAARAVRGGRARARPAARCRRHAHGPLRARRDGDSGRRVESRGRSHSGRETSRSRGRECRSVNFTRRRHFGVKFIAAGRS